MPPRRQSAGKVSYAAGDDDSDASEAVGSRKPRRAAAADSDDESFGEASSASGADVEDEEEDDVVESEPEEEKEDEEASPAAESSEEEDVLPEPAPVAKKKAAPRKSAKAKAGPKYGSDGELIDASDDDELNVPGRIRGLDESLPPIIALDDIFADLVSRCNLDNAVKNLNGRKLRVGTMCSGTESPLLALGIISSVIGKVKGQKLEAYIERNFSPPFLFRDVTELGDDEAYTAYGGLAPVPGNIDILVAGTSCVDYSPLNTVKKTIKAGGESGRTFFGMIDYVTKHRPKVVILENVSSAPWGAVVEEFAKIKYNATFVRLDTKSYYIPHTRSRGYLMATPMKSGSSVTDKWKSEMERLRRPASVSLEAFLLPSDDPRVARARAALSTAKLTNDGVKRAPTDWAKCESRHHRAREEELLGQKRYLTGWRDAGGAPEPMQGIWAGWLGVQTERVTDLIDISGLRQATKMVDVQSKSAVWNLSQNVDRSTASPVYGIAPCLTPNMIPFLTVRGGPLIGEEALSLQGIPIDVLLLTRETEDNLADLAGNAMSSTVVGAAILAALQVAGHTLDVIEDAPMDDASEVQAAVASTEERIRGENRLTQHDVDLSSVEALDPSLLVRANLSARKCECEGRRRTATAAISACSACTYSTCADCKARPEHRYVDVDFTDASDPENVKTTRIAPDQFEAEIMRVLPMRFTLEGFGADVLERKVSELEDAGVPVHPHLRKSYLAAIPAAIKGHEFHFRGLIRRAVWVATFANAYASLDLTLDPSSVTWTLTVKADAKLAANDPFRTFLQEPVARLALVKDATSLIDGTWDVRVPLKNAAAGMVTIEHIGKLDEHGQPVLVGQLDKEGKAVLNEDGKPVGQLDKEGNALLNDDGTPVFVPALDEVPSWRADLGLPTHLTETRARRLKVTASPEAIVLLDRQIDGEYVLEDKCGAPTNSLYRRVGDVVGAKPLYLFLDPTRSGQPDLDFYVFAESCDRLDYGSFRSPIAHLPAEWWPATRPDNAPESLSLMVSSSWSPLSSTKIERGIADASQASTISMPSVALDLAASAESCAAAECLLSARVHLAKDEEAVEADVDWRELDLTHQGPDFFSKFAWVFARLPQWSSLQNWQSLDLTGAPDACETCCPPAPPVRYVKPNAQAVNAVKAIEDGSAAAKYEQALKARPEPMLVQTRQIGDSFDFRIGLNVPSLAHKALAALPVDQFRFFAQDAPSVEWRLTPADGVDLDYGRARQATVFDLSSNKLDAQSAQPPHFKAGALLRPEQLRSLTWMIAQEFAPTPWVEEEIAEAVLPQLGWHAEVKATRSVHVRGGVLADEVGYGKTAITLGLISSQLATTVVPDDLERIGVKATLIIVPSHLVKQWPAEIRKFTSINLTVVTIININDLKKRTIRQIMDADIVVCADTVLKSPLWWEFYGDFCGVRLNQDAKAGRYFRTRVTEATAALPDQIRRLRDEGTDATLKFIKAGRKNHVELQEEPEKRKKGAAYADQKAREDARKKAGIKEPVAKEKKPKKEAAPKKEPAVDPWNLAKAKNWKDMNTPSLAMFAFNRLVIDEFTYLDGAQLTAIKTFRASSRWILSGTPPLKDFGELKTISALLQVHLGIDDENETTSNSVKNKKVKEQTAAEKFHSFKEVRTAKWHTRRDQVGQKFLNQFVRQNIAEIEEIPYSETIVEIQLPAAEIAIYSELYHHLLAFDENLQKIVRIAKKLKGDREVRLSAALGDSKSPEEALLKRSSHFSLDMERAADRLDNATNVCDHILSKRVKQSDDCKSELLVAVETAIAMHAWLVRKSYYVSAVGSKKGDDKPFEMWLKGDIYGAGVGDDDTAEQLRNICTAAGCENGKIPKWDDAMQKVITADPKLDQFKALKPGSSESKIEENRKARVWSLRELVHRIRRLQKELVGRNRSQRTFRAVRDVQNGEIQDVPNTAILTCCGHHGPIAEVRAAATDFVCIEPSCRAPARLSNMVLASTLCVDAESGTFGAKLEKLVDIISNIPDTERILVFVQFDDLFTKVEEALKSYGIPVSTLDGNAKQRSDMLDAFQNSTSKQHKVMLLKVTDKSASGANLMIANTAIFISPLLTDSLEEYKSFETQAIGRIRRYGQKKDVKVYRLLSKDTIDIDTYEQRSKKKVSELVAAQGEVVIPRTTLPMRRVHLEKKKKKSKKKKASEDGSGSSNDGSSGESEAESTGDEKPKSKKAVKSKAPPKPKVASIRGPGKKVAAAKKAVPKKPIEVPDDEDDEDDEPVITKKAGKGKAKAKVAADSDVEMELDESPSGKGKGKATVAAVKSTKRPVADDDVAGSSKPTKVAKRASVSVVVPPLSPSQRASFAKASRSTTVDSASASVSASASASASVPSSSTSQEEK